MNRVATMDSSGKENHPLSDPEMEDFRPPTKKARLKEPTTKRQMERIKKGFVPKNTENTAWDYNIFLEWKAQWNKDITAGEEEDVRKYTRRSKVFWLY